MDNQQTFEQWSAEAFLLDELDRTPDINERLVALYDYLRATGGDYSEEVEEDM